jgi:serine/threonine-protein phosphatase 6 regulatory ankyrin repeat subunit B
MFAAYNGHLETVRLLLDNGAMPDSRSLDGGSALYWAASQGHSDIVLLLSKRGADINMVRTCKWTPLMAAIYNGHEGVAILLVQAGARADFEPYAGVSMFQWAVEHGRSHVADFLRRHKRSGRLNRRNSTARSQLSK